MSEADKTDRLVRIVVSLLLYLSAALFVVLLCNMFGVAYWHGVVLYILGLIIGRFAKVYDP